MRKHRHPAKTSFGTPDDLGSAFERRCEPPMRAGPLHVRVRWGTAVKGKFSGSSALAEWAERIAYGIVGEHQPWRLDVASPRARVHTSPAGQPGVQVVRRRRDLLRR